MRIFSNSACVFHHPDMQTIICYGEISERANGLCGTDPSMRRMGIICSLEKDGGFLRTFANI